jgi:hypothetical protein
VPWDGLVSLWLELLGTLSKKPTELRRVDIIWHSRLNGNGTRKGLGADVPFVRALVGIRGLEELRIEGHDAKRWPSYLEENMSGVRLRVGCDVPLVVREGEGEDDRTARPKRELNERDLRNFADFQSGTKDLLP